MRQPFSHIPHRGVRTGRRRLLAITALVVLLYAVDVLTGGSIRAHVHAAGAFLSTRGGAAGSAITGTGLFATKAGLESRNRALSDELSALRERAAYADVLKAENDDLRAIVGIAGDRKGITAPVVSSVRSSPYGTFLIGAGEAEGITRGSIVLSGAGFVLGSVSETDAHTAVVTYVFAPSSSIEATLHGTPVVLDGSGGGNAETDVPRGLSVNVGDTVISPALGGRPIGTVGSVASSSSSAAQHVLVRLPINLSALRFVYVIPF